MEPHAHWGRPHVFSLAKDVRQQCEFQSLLSMPMSDPDPFLAHYHPNVPGNCFESMESRVDLCLLPTHKMVCDDFGPTVQEWVVLGLVRNTHQCGFARPTSGMLPSTAVDGCMDRVVVVFFQVLDTALVVSFPIHPRTVAQTKVMAYNKPTTQTQTPWRLFRSPLLPDVWLWKGGMCASVCVSRQANSVSQFECGKKVRGQSIVQVDG